MISSSISRTFMFRARTSSGSFFVRYGLTTKSETPTAATKSSSSSSDAPQAPTKPQYIHPLSQIVLTHLQNNRVAWTRQQGLDQSLSFASDGTFELKFPGNNQDRLWTSYDRQEKKHYLTVQKGDFVGRYMLQDNTRPAWQDESSKTSTHDKIMQAVDDMIAMIEQKEQAAKTTE